MAARAPRIAGLLLSFCACACGGGVHAASPPDADGGTSTSTADAATGAPEDAGASDATSPIADATTVTDATYLDASGIDASGDCPLDPEGERCEVVGHICGVGCTLQCYCEEGGTVLCYAPPCPPPGP